MSELELFAWLKWSYFKDLEKSEDQFASFDCLSTSKRIYLELKCRKTHYDDLLIEKSKYQRLIEKAWEFDYNAWYVNSTPLGVWAFNLNTVSGFDWVSKALPATTEFSKTESIEKIVGYLNIKDGVKL